MDCPEIRILYPNNPHNQITREYRIISVSSQAHGPLDGTITCLLVGVLARSTYVSGMIGRYLKIAFTIIFRALLPDIAIP